MECEPIRLRWHKWELSGTLYFEFQPGAFAGRHWQPESVFVREEFVADLERVVARLATGHGAWAHYGATVVPAAEWPPILAGFEGLAMGLRRADRSSAAELLPSLFRWFEPVAGRNWRRYVLQYAALTSDLSAWVRGRLGEQSAVSVLGI